MVHPTQLSVLRMKPVAQRIRRAAQGRLAIFRVLNSYRGWTAAHSPLHDASWALERAIERVGSALPACLVGHSLGGRAALLGAGLPAVHSVVALAPWVYPTDVAPGSEGKRILFVHGTADRIASPDRSRALAAALRARAQVSYVEVVGGRHAMLGRRQAFEGLAAQFVALTLLGRAGGATMRLIAGGESDLRV